MQRLSTALPKLQRYAVAGLGPVSGAVAQFALSLLLLHLLTPAEFGSFSFLLVTSIFAAGIWSALFCAPLPVLLNNTAIEGRAALLRCIFAVSCFAAAIAFAFFVGLGLLLARPWTEALLFALYAALFLLRWFARAYFYAIGNRLRTMASDLAFSATLIIGIGVLVLRDMDSLILSYGILAASAATGLLTFGVPYLKDQFLSLHRGALTNYRSIWRMHAGWGLVGIISTEATLNAHVYLVTLIAGPTAYAPIAATALLIRPIGVVQNALEEFERASMAIDLSAGRIGAVLVSATQFRAVLIAGLLATATAAAAMFAFFPRLIFPPDYSLTTLITGATLWMFVAGVRLTRVPQSTMLQAAGEFRRLASTSVAACGFSVVAVLILVLLVGPLWSIGGIIVGELAFCLLVLRQARQWRSNLERDRETLPGRSNDAAESIGQAGPA